MATPKEYQKLPGRGTRFEGARWIAGIRKGCTLWRASDHILLIMTSGWEQEFKRFYFRDIQAITVRRTSVGVIFNFVLFGLAGLFGLAAATISEPGGTIALGIPAALFCLFGILNVWRGPTCITELRTAVQTEELSSLKRRHTAEKTLAILHPLIEQAQGALSTENIQSQLETILPASAPAGVGVGTVVASRVSSIQQGALRLCSGRVHQLLYALLLLDGMMHLLAIFIRAVALHTIGALVSLGVAVAVITAMIQQYQSNISEALRRMTWVACGYVVISQIVGVIQGVVLTVTNRTDGANQWEMLKAYADIDPWTTPWLLTVLIVFSTISFVLGTMGTLITMRFRRQKTAPPIPPPVPAAPTDTPVA